jgi:uncharacterized protein
MIQDAPHADAPRALAETLDLADWRRKVADLYAEVRKLAAEDPREAWDLWREVRERLFRSHSQSPVPAAARAKFRAHHWRYDPAMRFAVEVLEDEPEPPAGVRLSAPPGLAILQLPMSAGAALDFQRVGRVELPFPSGSRELAVYWMAGYAGGLFLPFRDATNGSTTYAAGRYLLDTAKSADLGTDGAGKVVLDFNFAFHPSCAFDPRWSCPLAPPDNRLDLAIEAGERLG